MLQPDKKKRTHSGSRSVSLITNRNPKSTEDTSTQSMSEASTLTSKMLKSKPKIAAASIGLDPHAKIQLNKKSIRTHSSTQKI